MEQLIKDSVKSYDLHPPHSQSTLPARNAQKLLVFFMEFLNPF